MRTSRPRRHKPDPQRWDANPAHRCITIGCLVVDGIEQVVAPTTIRLSRPLRRRQSLPYRRRWRRCRRLAHSDKKSLGASVVRRPSTPSSGSKLSRNTSERQVAATEISLAVQLDSAQRLILVVRRELPGANVFRVLPIGIQGRNGQTSPGFLRRWEPEHGAVTEVSHSIRLPPLPNRDTGVRERLGAGDGIVARAAVQEITSSPPKMSHLRTAVLR